jgi:hypothetical protein
MGPGAYHLFTKLKARNPKDFADLWAEWEKERRVIGLAQSVIADYAPGPTNHNVFKDLGHGKETAKERRLRKRVERKRSKRYLQDDPDRRGVASSDRGDHHTTGVVCKVCGRNHPGLCRLRNHPDANMSDKSWPDSEMGKRWKAKGHDSLPGRRKLDGDPWVKEADKRKTTFRQSGRKHGESWAKAKYEYMYAMQYVDDDEYTLPCQIHNEYVTSPLSIRVLIDTGALQSNYISLKTAARLQKARVQRELESREGSKIEGSCKSAEPCSCLDVEGSAGVACCNTCVINNKHSNSNDFVSSVVSLASSVQNNNIRRLNLKTRNKTKTGKSITALRRTCLRRKLEKTNNNKSTTVCSGITGMCTESPGELSFNLTYFDSSMNKEETIPVTAKILDTPYDLIIGRPAIKKHNLTQRIGNHLYVESTSKEPLRAWQTSLKEQLQFRDSNRGTDGSSMLSMLY